MFCLFAVVALAVPRAILGFIWLFTPFVQAAFDGFIFPALGIVFLPLATLIYALVAPGGPSGLGWILVAVALVLDLVAYTGAYGHRYRTPFTIGERSS